MESTNETVLRGVESKIPMVTVQTRPGEGFAHTNEKLDELKAVRRSIYALHLRMDDVIDYIMKKKG